MPNEALVPLLQISVWFIVKIFFLVALAVYVVFAAVVIKQISLMTKTVKVGFAGPLKAFGYAHLAAAVAVFLIALFFL